MVSYSEYVVSWRTEKLVLYLNQSFIVFHTVKHDDMHSHQQDYYNVLC